MEIGRRSRGTPTKEMDGLCEGVWKSDGPGCGRIEWKTITRRPYPPPLDGRNGMMMIARGRSNIG